MPTLSLKKQLIKSTVFTTVLLGAVGFFLISFLLVFDENSIFDDLLKANANALLQDNLTHSPNIEMGLRHLNEQMDIEYQVINPAGFIVEHTKDSPSSPFLLSFNNDEYYNVYKNHQWWRVYVLYNQNKDRFVQIAQPYGQRLEFVLPKIVNYLIGVAIFLLVLVAVNGFVIKRSLKPLDDLTSAIAQKHLQELSPITPSVQLSEITPLILAINELFDRLNTASQAQERFVADASHELRTPLSAVQMKLQLLLRKFGDNPTLADQLGKLKDDTERAVALVESLLALARLDNVASLPKTPVAVGQWLDALLVSNRDKFGEWANITLSFDDKAYDCVVQGNLPLLTSAVQNLIDNAVRYGGGGIAKGVQVAVGVALVQTAGQNFVKIVVQDDGIGVDDDDRARLGERFFRVLGNTATGAGLGLSIVGKIAERHGGKLGFVDGLPNGVGKTGFGAVLTLAV